MTVGTVAVGFVVLPVTIIDVTVSVDKPSLAVGLVIGPVTFVHGAIRPDLDTFSLTYARVA